MESLPEAFAMAVVAAAGLLMVTTAVAAIDDEGSEEEGSFEHNITAHTREN